jgi:hypothetical protein
MSPERTCAACREQENRDVLVRLVAHPETGRVVVDLAGRLPGRGVWLHARRGCLDRVVRQPGRLQVLRDGPVDASSLAVDFPAAILRAALDALSLAAASGALIGGFDLLSGALRRGEVACLVLASDASERTTSEIRSAADGIPAITLPLDRTALGARIGKGPRAALGVRPTRSTAGLLVLLRRLGELG